MDIQEQERTFDGFMKYGARATLSIIFVMVLLAAFVA